RGARGGRLGDRACADDRAAARAAHPAAREAARAAEGADAMIRLDALTEVADRPFAALAWTGEDLAVMERMLEQLRKHIETLPTVTTQPAQRSRDDHFADPDGQG